MTNILLHETLNSSHFLSHKFSFHILGEDALSCCHFRFFFPSTDSEDNHSNFFSRFRLPKIKPRIILLSAIPENLGNPSLSNNIEFAIPQVFLSSETSKLAIFQRTRFKTYP